MTTGERIKALRVDQGLSLRALAREAEMSVGYLSKLEQDESSPTVSMLERLADALRVPLDELVVSRSEEELKPRLPESLKEFIDAYAQMYPEVADPEWQRALSQVRLRGKYPKDRDEWAQIFLSMRNALKE